MKWLGVKPSTTNGAAVSPTRVEEPAPPLEPVPATSAGGKRFGLENFGNTCYANSVIQALYFCGPFRELIIQSSDPSLPHDADQILVLPPAPPAPPSPGLTSSASAPQLPSRNGGGRLRPGRQATSETIPTVPTGGGSGPTAAPAVPGSTLLPPNPTTLYSALRSLFVHIARNPADRGTVAPRAFVEKLKELNEAFRTRAQQDAHEFLNYTLNQITEEMMEARRAVSGSGSEDLSNSVGSLAAPTLPDASLVNRLFEGILTSETKCLTCESVSSRDETFLDLSVDIEQNSSITACLRQFSASEMLCQRNKFFCDTCCDLQEAEKRMKIKKLPNVLALHLKRFKYREDRNEFEKLAYRVAFPFELRLFNTVDDAQNMDRLYELFAIVVHIGGGPHQGHYITVVKCGGEWFVFDDLKVDPIKESDIPRYYGEASNCSAYVLYYQAVDVDYAALGIQRTEPVPAPVSQTSTAASVATSHSPSLRAADPALPPGLVPSRDHDSDTATTSSDPSLPETPAHGSAPRLTPLTPITVPGADGGSTADRPQKPPLNISTNRSDGSVPASTVATPSRNKFAFSKSERDAPVTPAPEVSHTDVSRTPGGSSRAEKEKKERDRTWYGKRKSFRHSSSHTHHSSGAVDPPPASPSVPPMSAIPGGSASVGWFRSTSGQGTKRAPSGAASDSGYDSLSQVTATAASSSEHTSTTTASRPPSVPPSPTKSRHHPHADLPPSSPIVPFPAPLTPKRSQPALGARSPHRRGSVDVTLAPRPSTAGEATASSSGAAQESAPPLPPLPAGITVSSPTTPPARSAIGSTGEDEHAKENGFGTFPMARSGVISPVQSHASQDSQMPLSAHHTPPSVSPGAYTSTPPPAFNSATVMKRASRKLSFTLGLNKKNKDKHKEEASPVSARV